MREDCMFFAPVRVRYGEVDQQGVVYNGNYIIYTDVAFEEFLRSKGYSYKELSTKFDSEVCHIKTTIEYKASAFEGDLLQVGVKVVKIGNKSFSLGYEIYREDEDEPIVEAESVYVGLDLEKRVSKPLTPLLRDLLSGK